MMPSPYSRAAPNTPSAIMSARRRLLPFASWNANDSSARMPPSPRLSARSTNSTYFVQTMSTSVQTINDSTPNTFVGSTPTPWLPAKHSRSA